MRAYAHAKQVHQADGDTLGRPGQRTLQAERASALHFCPNPSVSATARLDLTHAAAPADAHRRRLGPPTGQHATNRETLFHSSAHAGRYENERRLGSTPGHSRLDGALLGDSRRYPLPATVYRTAGNSNCAWPACSLVTNHCRTSSTWQSPNSLTVCATSQDSQTRSWPPSKSNNAERGSARDPQRRDPPAPWWLPAPGRRKGTTTSKFLPMAARRWLSAIVRHGARFSCGCARQGSSISAVHFERTAHPGPPGGVSADQRRCVRPSHLGLTCADAG